MNVGRRFGWRDLVVFCAPLVLVLAYVFVTPLWELLVIRSADNVFELHMRDLIDRRLDAVGQLTEARALEAEFDPAENDPSILRLAVPLYSWRDLTSGDPIKQLGEWVEAALITRGGTRRLKMRPRGDRGNHWLGERRSFTMRLDDKRLYRGLARINVTKKLVLEQTIGHQLREDLGLLSPWTDVVRIFVNDRYFGLFRGLESPDETFLRRSGRMPGNVFRLDTFGREERYRGIEPNGFLYATFWDRTANNDRPAVRDRRTVEDVLRALATPGLASHEKLMSFFETNELGRYFTLLLLNGDLFHANNIHNQFWYEDPSTGRLHPIAIDVLQRRLDVDKPPVDSTIPSNLHRRFLSDPKVVAATLVALEHAIEVQRLHEVAKNRSFALEARHRDFMARIGLEAQPGGLYNVKSAQYVADLFAHNASELARWYREPRVATGSATTADGLVLDIQTRAMGAARLVALDVGERASDAMDVEVWADVDLDGVLSSSDVRLATRASANRVVLEAPELLVPAWNHGVRGGLLPQPQHYRFLVRGTAQAKPVIEAAAAAGKLTVEDWPTNDEIRKADAIHAWAGRKAPKAPRVHELSGDVLLEETLRIAAGDTLRIAPGSTVRLAPGVSILSYGRIDARGTADAPVIVRADDPTRPFGAFAVQGRGADGTRLSHVTVQHGSGATLDRVEYMGMVNVHHARDVVVSDSVFRENMVCDDTFHALHAEVHLARVRFENTKADAVDYDQADGSIVGCTFESSGNDAIDLMTSSPTIRGNRIVGSDDKGISVGEASHPVIHGNVIDGCVRGIEIKDRSAPLIVGNEIKNNGIGILAAAKNWRYGGGGRPVLLTNEIASNRTDFEVRGSESRITRTATIGSEATALLIERQKNADAAPLDWRFEASFARNAYGFVAPTGRVFERGIDLVVAGRGRPVASRPIDPPLPLSGGRFVVEGRATDETATVALVMDDGSRVGAALAAPQDGSAVLVTAPVPTDGRAVAMEIVGRAVVQRISVLAP